VVTPDGVSILCASGVVISISPKFTEKRVQFRAGWAFAQVIWKISLDRKIGKLVSCDVAGSSSSCPASSKGQGGIGIVSWQVAKEPDISASHTSATRPGEDLLIDLRDRNISGSLFQRIKPI
jgi:hypothetical protein